jgi:hypothetical protein
VTFSRPRIEKEQESITDWIQPKGGSAITSRCLYALRPCLGRRLEGMALSSSSRLESGPNTSPSASSNPIAGHGDPTDLVSQALLLRLPSAVAHRLVPCWRRSKCSNRFAVQRHITAS